MIRVYYRQSRTRWWCVRPSLTTRSWLWMTRTTSWTASCSPAGSRTWPQHFLRSRNFHPWDFLSENVKLRCFLNQINMNSSYLVYTILYYFIVIILLFEAVLFKKCTRFHNFIAIKATNNCLSWIRNAPLSRKQWTSFALSPSHRKCLLPHSPPCTQGSLDARNPASACLQGTVARRVGEQSCQRLMRVRDNL